MSNTKKAKPSMKELAGAVDRLGSVRAEKKKLEGEEKDLKKFLDPHLTKGVTIEGERFIGSKTIPTNRVADNAKVIKKLGIDWFIQNATVAIGVLSDKLGAEDVDRVVNEVDGAPRINTDPI